MISQNPYEAPRTDAVVDSNPRSNRSALRILSGSVVLLLAVVPGLTATFGILHVYNRGGWTQEGIKLVIVLIATSMFFVASLGLGLLGVGILRARRAWSVSGLATFATAVAVYFLLFAISR